MLSLTTLQPDILYEILDHLPRKSICHLLRTCKALYPICHRHLWRYLILNNRHDPGNWYPGHAIIGHKKIFINLLKLIRAGNPLGFEHMRVLFLGYPVFDKEMKDVTWDFRKKVEEILEGGGLGLREVGVTYSGGVVEAAENPKTARDADWIMPLPALKKFSETKTIRDFSLKVDASTLKSFLTYINPTLITHFDIWLSFDQPKNEWHTVQQTFTSTKGLLDVNIREFVSVIRGMVNLQVFRYTGANQSDPAPPLVTVSKEIDELQAVFLGLNRLREIELEGWLFHPWFFLNPPDTVTKYSVSGPMATKWWEGFSQAPLTNVTDLRLSSAGGHGPYLPRIGSEPIVYRPEFLLKDVACRGVRKLTIQILRWMPPDVEVCIMRRNPGIGNSREMAENKVKLLIGECYGEIIQMKAAASKAIRRQLPERFLTNPGGVDANVKAIKEAFIDVFMTGRYKGLSPNEIEASNYRWDTLSGRFGANFSKARSKEVEVGPTNRLLKHLERCIEMVLDKYIHKYGVTPPQDKEDEFMQDCILNLSNAEGIQEWIDRKREILKFLGLCERRMEREIDRQRGGLTEELIERFLGGEVLERESLMVEWKGLLAEGFFKPEGEKYF
ncbi:hypothetical protein TWF718_005844 [Orbilia javanica]|uniref:F-box domain-containing protein n=1 Tax=Orbilia javanica TaxID=47235 RepID=A0AAN8RJQ8_9PEZI